MSKVQPSIITPFNDRQRFKNLILEVINDTSIYEFNPDVVSIIDDLFVLVLTNKKFTFEEIKVDRLEDYIDIYITGIKLTSDGYSVELVGNNIVINFLVDVLILSTEDVLTTDFVIKGKIVEI